MLFPFSPKRGKSTHIQILLNIAVYGALIWVFYSYFEQRSVKKEGFQSPAPSITLATSSTLPAEVGIIVGGIIVGGMILYIIYKIYEANMVERLFTAPPATTS